MRTKGPMQNRLTILIARSHIRYAPAVPAGLLASLLQRGQEPGTIRVILENRLAAVAPIHDVIDGTGKLNSELARHAEKDGGGGHD